MRRMIWRTFIAASVVTALLVPNAASASAPKFHKVDSSVTNNGSLVVSFDERGLGHENVDYVLAAGGTATFACINGGGKNPSAANKRSVEVQVLASASIEPKNGRVVASITSAAPDPGDFSCPNGQKLKLADVSYTDIVLTDTTNGVSTSAPNAWRVFFTL